MRRAAARTRGPGPSRLPALSRAVPAAALLLLALLLPAGGAAAQTAPPTVPTADVTLGVTDLRPLAPRPGDDLMVLATLADDGATPLTDVEVHLGVGGRLDTRADLRRVDAQPPYYAPVTAATTRVPDLQPGAEHVLDVRVPVDDLPLYADGIYPLQIEVQGRRAGGVVEQLTAVQTYLPWFGTSKVDPLRVAWLWPLVDVPRQGPDEVMLDDGLASSLSADGRLGRSLRASRTAEAGGCPAAVTTRRGARAPTCLPVPVTYAVDPDLLLTAEAMTRPYRVLRGGKQVAGTGQQQAADWLSSLRAATASTDVVSLPFADPDVVALTRGTARLASDVAAARSYGITVTRDVLGKDPLQSVAFPPPGQLSDAGFDALTTSSTRSVVLEDDALVAPVLGSATPGTRVSLPPGTTSGPLTGLVVDRGLSDLLVPDRVSWQGARLAQQRWLVETAMIAAELPNRGRTLLVAPPRRADLDPALLGDLLTDTGSVPWMCPVQLADVVATRERCPGAAVPTYATPPDSALVQPGPGLPELDARDVADLADVRASAGQLAGSVLQGGTEQAQTTRARLQRAWLRAESSAWRSERGRGARLTRLLRADVDALRADVRVVTTPVTLTSSNGQVSVAVVNELDQPVTVAVRLEAPAEARLSEAQTEPLEVAAKSIVSVEVQAHTLTSGRFVVRAQLLDRDGRPFGAPEDLLVHSTRYGTAALAVTGLGAAVLLVAAGVRVVRRARGRGPAPAS